MMSEREGQDQQGGSSGGGQAGREEEGAAGSRRQRNENRRGVEGGETPLLEWVIAGVGLALVVGAVGFMLYQAVWGETTPPEVTVRVDAVVQTQNGYLVKIHAYNQGGSTAEGVVIQAELRRGAESAETSQTTLDYLPAHSERKGGLFFTQDPSQFELQVRAFGYEEP